MNCSRRFIKLYSQPTGNTLKRNSFCMLLRQRPRELSPISSVSGAPVDLLGFSLRRNITSRTFNFVNNFCVEGVGAEFFHKTLVFSRSRSRSRSSIQSRFLSTCKSISGTTILDAKIRPATQGYQSFTIKRKLSHKMSADDVLQGLDETQVELMREECILVDQHDKNIGSASKKTCHLLENINKGMLHRAFSVFLFNAKGELLLQQRATAKITFPDHFTNTCCSHPLNFAAEIDENEAIGVKRAAQRKLKHELGIEPEQIPLEDFHYLTRILYQAENIPKDNKWGEHEIDYILFIQKDVTVVPNPNEVKSYRYVSQEDLKKFLNSASHDGTLITPWFQLIVQKFLYKWWNNLSDIRNQNDRKTIHNMLKS